MSTEAVGFERFIAQAKREPLLTYRQEIELAKRIEEGDLGARRRLILSNLRLVVSIANKAAVNGEAPELAAEGMLPLIDAVDRYDGRGRFSTYAYWHIKGAVLRALNGKPQQQSLDAKTADDPTLADLLPAEPPDDEEESSDDPEEELAALRRMRRATVSRFDRERAARYLARVCGCGCGESLRNRPSNVRYVSDAHRSAWNRTRRRQLDGLDQEIAEREAGIEEAERPATCRCAKPILQLDEDGDLTCAACGRLLTVAPRIVVKRAEPNRFRGWRAAMRADIARTKAGVESLGDLHPLELGALAPESLIERTEARWPEPVPDRRLPEGIVSKLWEAAQG